MIREFDTVEGILAAIEASRDRRAATYPTEDSALLAICQAVERLKELGWREGVYCPKDGTRFETCEAGSTGIHVCSYSGVWNEGFFMIEDGGDVWPTRRPPMLWRPMTDARLAQEADERLERRRALGHQ